MRVLVVAAPTRNVLNSACNKANWRQANWLHRNFSTMFADHEPRELQAAWSVSFAGRPIRFRLTSSRAWLDWDLALSVVGQDPEVKATYAALLKSKSCPSLFVDVGANYGTHALPFLAHGVPTLAFEPNPACVDYFREVCRLNEYEPTVEQVALGRSEGVAELLFPEGATWHGSTREGALTQEHDESDLTSLTVRVRTLDDYLPGFADPPILIKIDTEGSELAILSGASRTLTGPRPTIIFETLHPDERRPIFELLERFQYVVVDLPRSPGGGRAPMELSSFVASAHTNFLAEPAAHARQSA